ncbi:Asp23/Gls24 family envelope stress response protein [Rhodococcus sp. SGAir0479]|nr:Asp23/Gls24 family envelope stress response protein [Rhodococcus sp. SGAir0479]
MDDDPGTRGDLIIKDRVFEKIATTAALRVPGVVRQGGGFTRFTGRDLPRADVSTGAHSVALNLYLGVHWPCDVAELTRRVHREVGDEVENLTGMPLHQLGVLVAGTDTDDAADGPLPGPRPAAELTVAHPPTASPAAVPAAIVIAVGLLATAVVAARELLVAHDKIVSAPWVRNAFEWVARLHWDQWLVPVAVTSLVVGILFVLLALAPRTRTHVAARAGSGTPSVWLRPVDIARMCSARASAVAGVADVHTTVDRRRATVHVTARPGASGDDIRTAVTAAVDEALALLDRKFKLRVKIRGGKEQT